MGGPTFDVPKQTPFTLTATGSDVNGDTLSYDWQEYDLGVVLTAVPNTDAGGALPIFRLISSDGLAFANIPGVNLYSQQLKRSAGSIWR